MPWLAAAGAALAAGPILIHIIFRFRYKVVEFPEMRFLLEALKKHKQRLLIEEIIIIALRVLACVLIGMTLANLRLSSSEVLPGSHTPTAHIFVLDDSPSMGQRYGDGTLLGRAQDDLAERIAKLHEQDHVAILSGSEPRSERPLGRLTSVRELQRDEPFLRQLRAGKATDQPADFVAAASQARKLIPPKGNMQARVYVISDFRRIDWDSRQTQAAVRDAFKRLTDGASAGDTPAELTLLDYGLPCGHDLSVQRLRMVGNIAVTGIPVEFEAEVKNTGTAATQRVAMGRVVEQLGERGGPADRLEKHDVFVEALEPGQSAKVNFRQVFATAGMASVRVALPQDMLAADNAVSLAVPIRESLRVLVVDGSEEAGGPGSGGFFLLHALDPSGGKAMFRQKVDVVSPGGFGEADLGGHDLVILNNVRDLPAGADANGVSSHPLVAALERYVREGGGLVIFAGDRVNVPFYNGPMYAKGSGLSPLPLAGLTPPRPDGKQFVRLRPDSIAPDPMLRIFKGRTEKFSQLVRFYACQPVEQAKEPPVLQAGVRAPQVLAEFDGGGFCPAVVRRAMGKGTVLMWYAGLEMHQDRPDRTWTDWPKDPSFLAVMNEMAWSLAASGSQEVDGQVGQPIVYELPSALASAAAISLKTPLYPNDDVRTLQARVDEKRRTKVVEYPAAAQAGVYEMELTLSDGGRKRLLFSRHIDPEESELEKVGEGDLKRSLDREGLDYRGNLAAAKDRAVETAPKKDFWRLLLALAAAVLALETFLAQRFGHYTTKK
jgi:hypothetical protein